MSKYFEILNKFPGMGEPDGDIWFVGLEEAYQWREDPEEDADKYSKYEKGIFCAEAGEMIRDREAYGRNYTSVYEIMSKIAVGFSEIEGLEYRGWRHYRDNKLLQRGSKIFQTNVFPIGKKNRKEWPEYYRNLFGYGKDNRDKYADFVRKTRFLHLRDLWKNCKPKITICFGKEGWDEFSELFELSSKPYEDADSLRIYRQEEIILTPFFDYRFVSTELISAIAHVIGSLGTKTEMSQCLDIPVGKYNKWCERRPLIPSNMDQYHRTYSYLAHQPLTFYERSILLHHEVAECNGIEFVAFSNVCFKEPTKLAEDIFLFPCFLPLISAIYNIDNPFVKATLNMQARSRYIYDGWLPLDDWTLESLRKAIKKISVCLYSISLNGIIYFSWEPKYLYAEKSMLSSYHLNEHHTEKINDVLDIINDLPEVDSDAISRSLGWLNLATEVREVTSKFLFNILAIESLAIHIENMSKEKSPLRRLRSIEYSDAENRQKKTECIKEEIEKHYKSDAIKAIEKAYLDCVYGISRTIRENLMKVFERDTKPVDLLFRTKVEGKSLYELRHIIAHGELNVLSERQLEMVNSRIWDVESAAKKYVIIVLETVCGKPIFDDEDIICSIFMPLNQAVMSNEAMYKGPNYMSNIYY